MPGDDLGGCDARHAGPVHAGGFFLPTAHRSGVNVVAWARSFSNPSLWGATAAGSLVSTGLGCCPVTRSMVDLASWLGSLACLRCWSVIEIARKR
jgi:hypothetical protein